VGTVVVAADEFHILSFVPLESARVPYVSPLTLLVLSAYVVPDVSDKMLSVHTVAAPPTRFEKVPPTARTVLGASVKLDAAVSVVLRVDVACAPMVHPPEIPANSTS
jgi:hypothetical protein